MYRSINNLNSDRWCDLYMVTCNGFECNNRCKCNSESNDNNNLYSDRHRCQRLRRNRSSGGFSKPIAIDQWRTRSNGMCWSDSNIDSCRRNCVHMVTRGNERNSIYANSKWNLHGDRYKRCGLYQHRSSVGNGNSTASGCGCRCNNLCNSDGNIDSNGSDDLFMGSGNKPKCSDRSVGNVYTRNNNDLHDYRNILGMYSY